jgi:hypothetical protein
MSIIVVEGVDASGKSTLLEEARGEIRGKYFLLLRHSCRPFNTRDVSYFLSILYPFSRDSQFSIVVDRHPLISEPIYGPLLRNGDITSVWSDSTKLQYLLDTVERIIYCRPTREVIRENIDKNPQLAGVKDKLEDLIGTYDQMMSSLKQSGIKVISYDYQHPIYPLHDLFFGDIQ